METWPVRFMKSKVKRGTYIDHKNVGKLDASNLPIRLQHKLEFGPANWSFMFLSFVLLVLQYMFPWRYPSD